MYWSCNCRVIDDDCFIFNCKPGQHTYYWSEQNQFPLIQMNKHDSNPTPLIIIRESFFNIYSTYEVFQWLSIHNIHHSDILHTGEHDDQHALISKPGNDKPLAPGKNGGDVEWYEAKTLILLIPDDLVTKIRWNVFLFFLFLVNDQSPKHPETAWDRLGRNH